MSVHGVLEIQETEKTKARYSTAGRDDSGVHPDEKRRLRSRALSPNSNRMLGVIAPAHRC